MVTIRPSHWGRGSEICRLVKRAGLLFLFVVATGCGSSSTSAPPATSPPPTSTALSLDSVNWPSVAFPVAAHCRAFQPPVTVLQTAYADPAPGVHLAILLVKCNVGAGTPPVALYVYDRAISLGVAHLTTTLISDFDNWQGGAVNVSGSVINMPVAGFSSNSVPNCCPDVRTTLVWVWNGSNYQMTSGVPPHITGVPRGYY